MSEGTPCTWMRGGTSKGGYFLAADLPADTAERDAFLLAVGAETVLGHMHDLSAGLGILQLGQVDILRADTCRFEGCLRGIHRRAHVLLFRQPG